MNETEFISIAGDRIRAGCNIFFTLYMHALLMCVYGKNLQTGNVYSSTPASAWTLALHAYCNKLVLPDSVCYVVLIYLSWLTENKNSLMNIVCLFLFNKIAVFKTDVGLRFWSLNLNYESKSVRTLSSFWERSNKWRKRNIVLCLLNKTGQGAALAYFLLTAVRCS